MPQQIINGRMHIAGEDGIYKRQPLGMDEARDMKQNPPPEYVVQDGKPFEIIKDGTKYAIELQKKGEKTYSAEKSGCVIARMVEPGEKIETYSQAGILEASETGIKGCVLLTKAGLDGKPVVDEHGHVNQWQAEEATFRKKYDVPEGPIQADSFAKPKGGLQEFIPVDKDVAFMVPWGENGSLIPQTIEKGGLMNFTNPDDIYGISARDFKDTYQVIVTSGQISIPQTRSSRNTKDLDAAFNDITAGQEAQDSQQLDM